MKKLIILLILLTSFSVMGQKTPTMPPRTNGTTFPKDSSLAIGYALIPVYTAPSFAGYTDRPGTNFGLRSSNNRLNVRGTGAWLEFPSYVEVQSMIAAVPSGVTSVFGRTGVVTAQSGDYSSFYYPLTGNPSGFLTGFTETDPTVPPYAKSLTAFSVIKTSTDALYPSLAGSYANPAWITSLAFSKITGTPTTLSGYGITDAVPSSRTITINGTTFDLSANRSWTVGGGGSSYTFSNGLTESGGAVVLGGTMSNSVNLALQGTNYFNISGGSGVANSGFLNLAGGSGGPNVIGYAASGNARSISFGSSSMTVTDAISSKGLVYAGNYGVNFTDLSLITKRYADSIALASGGGLWNNSYGDGSRIRSTSNRSVDISSAVGSGFNSFILQNTSTGNGASISAGSGFAANISNSSASSAAATITNGGSGDILRLTNGSAGNRVVIDNNGLYNYGNDPTSILTPLTAVPKLYVDALIPQIVEVSGTTQTLQATRTYILHSSSLTTCTLPATANIGDLISIIGEGSGGFRVSQNASQFIVSGNASTTTGTGGYIQTTTNNTFVSLRCVAANKFMVTSSNSAITIN